jgi:ubiquinone/menaquinone biosynthesis C-methylase UbiE
MKKEDYIRHWNNVAADYCSRIDEMALIYQPDLYELIGDISGKQVLDAGCGDGSSSRKLVSLGAVVTGIDGSHKMISAAKELLSPPRLNYKIADLMEQLPFPDSCYDVVLANMVLMDIPKIDMAISEFSRILRKDGILVFSITHPCFFCSDWIAGENGEYLYKAISDYLIPRIEELNFWGKTVHFHRPLSQYFDVLSRNDFCVDAFREPMPSDEAVREHPEWSYHRRIPSFVVIRAGIKR